MKSVRKSFIRAFRTAAALLITGALFLAAVIPARGAPVPQGTASPEVVGVPGTIQSALGCGGNWLPECEQTFLVYDLEDDVWQGSFLLPAGAYEYKAALNGSWDENYGLTATRDGQNILLELSEEREVKFYYDHKTHWITDNVNSMIVVAAGSFQSEAGCANDNDPSCLLTWMQDPEGDGEYSFLSPVLPGGVYTATAAINETFAETYGVGGEPGGPAYQFTVPAGGARVFFGFDPSDQTLRINTGGAPKGNLKKSAAHWVSRDTILWNVPERQRYTFSLHYDPESGLSLDQRGVTGGNEIPLIYDSAGPPQEVLDKFPHLSGYAAFKLLPEDVEKAPEILKGQIAVSARNETGKLVDATSLQIPGVLDDLYPYTGPLGVTYDGEQPTLRVWAPTARSVSLYLYETSQSEQPIETAAMLFDSQTGVWSAVGREDWTGKFYLYEVEVFAPATGKVERNLVTDPYSVSLSTNSQKSQIVDLDSRQLKPTSWDDLKKPALAAPEDSVIYELHVRDFSAFDMSIPPHYRGTYLAFTQKNSDGMQHLKTLAQAGLTHIHLLPVFDFATVDENPENRREPDIDLLQMYPGDSERQQEIVGQTRDVDAFNWGYDPLHYSTPEGSYSTDPDGTQRILEFRQMVQSLNSIGLRVVMDVVYNHTHASGQDPRSVLDRIVPGYYHRLSPEGAVETSTCCQNTATEHAMMEKLMIDSMVTWAKAYKVDGFRMDLMGHHMLRNIENARAALDSLTLEKDGVDGKSIYIYGEGWDFGEVANNARGVNASQINTAGTGVGTFNDRLRDAARGGSPFDDPRTQGFVTGLHTHNNGFEKDRDNTTHSRLLHYSDLIRIGMAGNLAEFSFIDEHGKVVTGSQVPYNGNPAGYTKDPQENVVYVSSHDNQTLFDAIQLKAAEDVSLLERVRMQNLGISLVLLSQGVPFFHAGDEQLRSKSLDENSYNSGDWFNRLDFTYGSNNWAVGLPPGSESRKEMYRALLSNEDLVPGFPEIQSCLVHFLEMLQVRKSTPLLRLRTAQDIQQRLAFFNTGPDQIPGLIVMTITDQPNPDLDEAVEMIAVLINANPNPVNFSDDALIGFGWELHPILAESADPVARTSNFDPDKGFTIPGRTAAVFTVKTLPMTQEQIATAITGGVIAGAALLFGGLVISRLSRANRKWSGRR